MFRVFDLALVKLSEEVPSWCKGVKSHSWSNFLIKFMVLWMYKVLTLTFAYLDIGLDLCLFRYRFMLHLGRFESLFMMSLKLSNSVPYEWPKWFLDWNGDELTKIQFTLIIIRTHILCGLFLIFDLKTKWFFKILFNVSA